MLGLLGLLGWVDLKSLLIKVKKETNYIHQIQKKHQFQTCQTY